MQYLNDDMDDLFRRAAENYPLDTKSADWDKIAAELEIKPAKSKDRIYKDRRLFWLLLLLPLSFVCNHYIKDGTLKIINENKSESVNTLSKRRSNTLGKELKIAEGIKYKSKPGVIKNAIDPINSISIAKSRNQLSNGIRIDAVTNRGQTGMPATNKTHMDKGWNQLESLGHDDFKKVITKKNEPFTLLNNYPGPVFNLHSFFFNPIVKENDIKIIEVQNPKQKRIYAGIMGGIDGTSIKFQKISNAGYSFGVILGYKLNNRWSIESGLFHDKKYYYSEGQYLNTAKMYILPGTKINSLDGNCSMWEIPLLARYNFKYSKNKKWFSTLGLSSYFMKKENYDYTYTNNATGQTYDKYRTYNNASKHFFSVISISAGFANPITKTIDLRVEPYLKIPVKGVGVGAISLQSAGLQVGITKTIF